MSIRFDFSLASALVNGMPVPIDAVYSFCQDAYDSFNEKLITKYGGLNGG